MPRWPLTLTWEWTTVVPDDHRMAPFVNGQVVQRDEHEPLQFKSGALYRRRVLIWRGGWQHVESSSGNRKRPLRGEESAA